MKQTWKIDKNPLILGPILAQLTHCHIWHIFDKFYFY